MSFFTRNDVRLIALTACIGFSLIGAYSETHLARLVVALINSAFVFVIGYFWDDL